jgi:DNA anti-recombination protein RmuC
MTSRTKKATYSTKTPHGIAGDRFVVELKGRQYFVIDAKTSMVMGGPYSDRVLAQNRADALQRNLGVR